LPACWPASRPNRHPSKSASGSTDRQPFGVLCSRFGLASLIEGRKHTIEDHHRDKHTGSGRRQGGGLEHWLGEPIRLTNGTGTEDRWRDEAVRLWRNRNELGKQTKVKGKTDPPADDDDGDDLPLFLVLRKD
jgi:hypothetical protein